MHNCDPPYVLSTRTNSEGIYVKEMTDEEHEELVDICLKLKGKVILSGYRNKIYEKLEENGWIRLDKEVSVRAVVVSEGQEKGKRVESVWLNYKVGRWLV
jgi:site-specific DNA-adenine methylase